MLTSPYALSTKSPTVAAIFILTSLRIRSLESAVTLNTVYCLLLTLTYIIYVCTAKQEEEAYLVSGDAKEQGRISGCYIH